MQSGICLVVFLVDRQRTCYSVNAVQNLAGLEELPGLQKFLIRSSTMIFLRLETKNTTSNKKIRNWKIPLFLFRMLVNYIPTSVYSFFARQAEISKENSKEDGEAIKAILMALYKVLEEAAKPEHQEINGSLLAEFEEDEEKTTVSIS
jgi:hypothetical protein